MMNTGLQALSFRDLRTAAVLSKGYPGPTGFIFVCLFVFYLLSKSYDHVSKQTQVLLGDGSPGYIPVLDDRGLLCLRFPTSDMRRERGRV